MIELLLPYGFDTLEYSWVKATIGICTLADYSMAKNANTRHTLDSQRLSYMTTVHKSLLYRNRAPAPRIKS
jgi:hypothetical protein